jgi:hypothetical protein
VATKPAYTRQAEEPEILSLRNVNGSEPAVEKLRRALPNCKIGHSPPKE